MGKPRVLFVDDEHRVLSALKRNLRDRAADWEMAFVNDPAEALDQYARAPFDVVVSDLSMPGMTGLEMVMQMRKSGQRTSFIMLTGTADLNAAVDAINKADVFRFFTKPCANDLLVEGICAGLRAVEADGEPKSPGNGGVSDTIGTAALNRLAIGVIVTDRTGRVEFANRAGGALLSEQDGLSLSATGILRASVPKQTEYLQAMIRAACGDSEDETSGLAIERPSHKRALTVFVTPLPDESGVQRAAVFVSDTEKRALPKPEAISRLFGLSRAESRLVHALGEGVRLEQAAEICGVTVSTARTYLKQIFAKTGTSRQAELLKLVLTTPDLDQR